MNYIIIFILLSSYLTLINGFLLDDQDPNYHQIEPKISKLFFNFLNPTLAFSIRIKN